MPHALKAESLQAAIKFAYHATGTRNVIIFDGAMGGLNGSDQLIQFLLDNAPSVEKKVERELMPKWLRQRGLSQDLFKTIKLSKAS
jgi:4-aminobutyrate aminotransferase-like enzyme